MNRLFPRTDPEEFDHVSSELTHIQRLRLEIVSYLRPKPKANAYGSCSICMPFSPIKRSGLKAKGS